MSTPAKKTEVELIPFQQENVATNQQDIALPYFAGERLVALRWISSMVNEKTKQAPSASKKS